MKPGGGLKVYYTENLEQFANYDFLMVFDAETCPQSVLTQFQDCWNEGFAENLRICAFILALLYRSGSTCGMPYPDSCEPQRVRPKDMGLSTFPWADYFRRYEDYASKWGIAPVTGADAWLFQGEGTGAPRVAKCHFIPPCIATVKRM